MLAEHKLKVLLDLVKGLSNDELEWVNGYINGINKEAHQALPMVEKKPVVNKITITYGTETGNSKSIATDLAKKARKKGINVKLASLDQYRLNDLVTEEFFFTIVSTHGDGEPPAAAKKFYDHIHNNGFKLDKLKYSVFALGDTAYPLFCKTGEDIDEQLSKLNGQRLLPLNKSDVEYDLDAHNWSENVLQLLSTQVNDTEITTAPQVISGKSATRNIYSGEVLAIIKLNDVGSHKETFHIEIKAGNPLYEPGDSIGIVPENSAELVDSILTFTGVPGNRETVYKGESYSIFNLLQAKVNISYLTLSLVQKYAAVAGTEIPKLKMDLIDLLKEYPLNDEQFMEVLGILNPIPPRLYTIASSTMAHENEVHLTVEIDEFRINGVRRYGICSSYLRLKKSGDEVKFFIQKNKRFRLPENDKPIIMIGPGTGIAAFRSFLYEREARGAEGQNWLFFGEQNFNTDFLYQTEIQNWKDTGLLTKVNVAFSGEEEDGMYVQDKILEHAEEFYQWIQKGAYIYVCGQKDPMSVQVEQTILAIIRDLGSKTKDEAAKYLEKLKTEGRYSVDVY